MSVQVASCSQLTITGHSFGSFPTISIPGLILCLLNKAVWVFYRIRADSAYSSCLYFKLVLLVKTWSWLLEKQCNRLIRTTNILITAEAFASGPGPVCSTNCLIAVNNAKDYRGSTQWARLRLMMRVGQGGPGSVYCMNWFIHVYTALLKISDWIGKGRPWPDFAGYCLIRVYTANEVNYLYKIKGDRSYIH